MIDNEENLLLEYRRLHDWLAGVMEERARQGKASAFDEMLTDRLTELARLDERRATPD